MKLAFLFLAALAVAQDNEAIDDKWNAKYQQEQRRLRKIIREWSADCRARIVGGTLQGQQNGLIACTVPQAQQIAPKEPPKPKPPAQGEPAK